MKKLFFASLFCLGMLCSSTLTQATTIVKPTLQIIAPRSGELSSNPVFTVTGKVTHVLGVSNVLYSLNEGAYQPATTTNGWTNWSASVTLSVGTNFISAYAVDTNGISSTTNKVKLFYVLVAPLTVETNGKAIITPKDNNMLLEIGKPYKLTVKGTDGFSLMDWTGGTSFPLSILTNKATVEFTMVSNLILVANMKDTEKPYLKITNWTSRLVVSNAMFTVMGRATDNVAVASVNYSLNGSTNISVGLTGASWSAPLTLSLGSNFFTVYAVDTSGNISPTNKALILRQPSVTKFEIVSNFVDYPQAHLAFDGTNYLVVYQVYSSSSNNGVAMGQFVSPTGKAIGVRLSLNPGGQNSPAYVDFDGSNYLAAWADYSQKASGVPVRGAFVSPGGTVVGSVTTLSQSSTVADFTTIVYGGGVYFLTWADGGTSPDSVYGAFINTSGFNESGDFLISSNAYQSVASGNSAAFDQTNFLAVWYSATGNTCIKGRLINSSGGYVGSPFVIYTNSLPAQLSTINVTFDGTKYLVLFSASAGSETAGDYHILGRFVTTGGTVLTNQMIVTSKSGPQIGPSADFDGVNYLISWNQGFNPSAVDTSTTVYGQMFNTEGKPASSEFTLFTTQSGAEIPLWAPVLWDGSKFVLVGGLGKLTSPLNFTNNVIYGEFVEP